MLMAIIYIYIERERMRLWCFAKYWDVMYFALYLLISS
jgi:hypothetical protein